MNNIIEKYKKLLTIRESKFARFIRALKRTLVVFVIITFGMLLGMSLAYPLDMFSRLLALGIFFVIIIYYNYTLEGEK